MSLGNAARIPDGMAHKPGKDYGTESPQQVIGGHPGFDVMFGLYCQTKIPVDEGTFFALARAVKEISQIRDPNKAYSRFAQLDLPVEIYAAMFPESRTSIGLCQNPCWQDLIMTGKIPGEKKDNPGVDGLESTLSTSDAAH